MTKTVTVLGASGFLGRYVVRRLALAGYTVRAGVRFPEKANFLKVMGQLGQVTPLAVPLQSEVAVRAAIKGSDAVINLVGIMFPRRHQQFESVHVDGVRYIAKAVKDFGVSSFVHVSAIGADEKSKANYARTKGEAEKIIKKQCPDAVILRPSIICGTEDNFFNLFSKIAKYSPIFPLIGGNAKFQPVYVENVAEAIVNAVGSNAYNGNVYEIGGPKTYTFKELMRLMLDVTKSRSMILPVPFWVANIQASFMELLRIPLLTRDQVKLLRQDNVVNEKAKTINDLNVRPMPIEQVIKTYLG